MKYFLILSIGLLFFSCSLLPMNEENIYTGYTKQQLIRHTSMVLSMMPHNNDDQGNFESLEVYLKIFKNFVTKNAFILEEKPCTLLYLISHTNTIKEKNRKKCEEYVKSLNACMLEDEKQFLQEKQKQEDKCWQEYLKKEEEIDWQEYLSWKQKEEKYWLHHIKNTIKENETDPYPDYLAAGELWMAYSQAMTITNQKNKESNNIKKIIAYSCDY